MPGNGSQSNENRKRNPGRKGRGTARNEIQSMVEAIIDAKAQLSIH